MSCVIGAQREGSPANGEKLEAGRVVETPRGRTSCGGPAGRFVSEKTLELAKRYADGIVLVKESGIVEAMRIIWRQPGVRVEPSAAVGIAALIEGGVEPGRVTVTVISGGNISRSHFEELTGVGRSAA